MKANHLCCALPEKWDGFGETALPSFGRWLAEMSVDSIYFGIRMVLLFRNSLLQFQFQAVDARGKTFHDGPDSMRNINAFLAVMAGGFAALDRIFELFSAGAASPDAGGGLEFLHGG